MNIKLLEKAVRTLRALGENELADEVWNVTTLYLYTEDDENDESYDMDYESDNDSDL
tara:strand:- start:420 stop:590 length:171 start_codon:yes stop_codon:yes gene_type:complete